MLHIAMIHVMLLMLPPGCQTRLARFCTPSTQFNMSSALKDGSHSPKAVNVFSVSRAKSVFVLYVQILHRSSMTYAYYLKQ